MTKFRMYRTYNYVDKNPVIDKVRTVLQDEGLFAKLQMVHDLSNVSASTLNNWFHGDTRHPQHHTIAAVITALGYEEKFVKNKDISDWDDERKKAVAWTARQPKPSKRKGKK